MQKSAIRPGWAMAGKRRSAGPRALTKILLVMRLTAFLLTVVFLSAHAKGSGQSVTLSGKDVSLKNIFSTIKKQTGYVVFYNRDLLEDTRPVSLTVRDIPLEGFLKMVLQDQPLNFRIDGKDIILSRKPALWKPSGTVVIDVRGTVTDDKGTPLPGATVRVKNTSNTVTTKQDGSFEVKGLQGKAVLIISFIGYKTIEVYAEGGSALNIQLELASEALQQVMVTGYQTISKERATGSFTTVGKEMLSKRPVSNISTALQGLVAGMQAKENEDGSMSFLIRGNTTLYADRRPLIVVDGFPIASSDFSDINPNDVESVTVLKDAAAASIWGARAANGVIVIVTKKARAGGKLQVNASAFTRISKMVDLDQVLTQANSGDQVAYERKAFDNGWFFIPYAGGFSDVTNSLTLAQELLFANKNGQISTADMNAGLDRLSKTSNRSQVRDQLMQRAILNQYNVSLQAGTDRTKTYASVMYESEKGAYKGNSSNRFNINLNNDFKLTNFLNFNIGANLQYRKRETSGATISEIQDLSPYEMLLNPDGSYGTNLKTYNREQLALIPFNKFPYSDWSYNLLREVNSRKLSSEALNARIQAGLNVKLMKGLTFDAKFQYERGKTDYADFYSENSFYARSLINTLTEYNNNTKTVGRSFIPKGGILKPRTFTGADGRQFDLSNTNLESYLLRNQLSFDRTLARKHGVSVIAGMELSQTTNTTQANPYVYGYFSDKLQATVPPYGYGSSLDLLTNFTGSTATVPGGNTVFGWERNKFVSFYGNASYTYDHKYTLSGSVRSDASNFITDDPALRWSPLWSVGAKWNVKEEDFMRDAGLFDRLELRLTYGKNGNVERSTSTKALLNVGSSLNASTGTITATVADNGNPGLRWEKTTSTNLGLDFAVLKNRLFGSIDIYNKKGEGIIGNIALPAASGTTIQKFNNAGITNKGIELTIGANLDIPNTPVRYTTSFNYAYNHNRINSLYSPSLYVYQLIAGEFVEGRPVNAVYSFTYKGMKDGIPQVAGPKGTLQSFNDVALYNRGLGLPFLNYEGTTTPPHTLGWVNTIQAYNFTLTAIFVGKLGGVYRNPGFSYAATVGSGKVFVNKFVNDVLAGNPDIPGFANPNETKLYLWDRYAPALSSLVESSSYIECKELTLDYNLPRKLIRTMHIDNLKVFAQSRDLGLVWKANSKGYNPDWLPGTNRPVQTYTFGVNLQF